MEDAMTMDDVMNETPKLTGRAWLRFAGGALVGALTGAAGAMLAKHAGVLHKHGPWQDGAVLWLTLVYGATALGLLIASFDRKTAAKVLGATGDELATPAELRFLRLQTVVSLIAATVLVLPWFAQPNGWAAGRSGLVFGVMCALFLVQTVANITLWHDADEFLRARLLETFSVTFAIGQGGLFLWAAAEHLGLVQAVTSWTLLIVQMLLYFAVSLVIGLRYARLAR